MLKILKKIIATTSSLALLLTSIPLNLQAADTSLPIEKTQAINFPTFPEDQDRDPTDWSQMDWDQEVTLPADREVYYQKLHELEDQNKFDEVEKLKLKKYKMSDDMAMSHYKVPHAVQKIIREYRQTPESNFTLSSVGEGVDSAEMKQKALTALIKKKQHDIGYLEVEDKFQASLQSVEGVTSSSQAAQDEVISINNDIQNLEIPEGVEYINVSQALTSMNQLKAIELKKEDIKVILQTETLEEYNPDKIKPASSKISLFNTVDNLMEYYEGIEKHTIEYFLYFLTLNQNEDGSFGDYHRYDITSQIVIMLNKYNRTQNIQYTKALNYLKNTEPQNNRDKAIKIRVLSDYNGNYQTLLTDLLSIQNEDGSFGYLDNYHGDLETSLEVLKMLDMIGQTGSDAFNQTLYYILNKINEDGSIFYLAEQEPDYYLINKTLEYLYPFRELTLAFNNENIIIQTKIDQMLNFLTNNYDLETDVLANSNNITDKLMMLVSLQTFDVEPEIQKILFTNTEEQQNYTGSFGDSWYANVAAMKALPRPDLALINMYTNYLLRTHSYLSVDLTIKNQGYVANKTFTINVFIDNYFIDDFVVTDITIPPQTSVIMHISMPTSYSIYDSNMKLYIETENELNAKNNWIDDTYTFSYLEGDAPAVPLFTAYAHTVTPTPGNPEPGLFVSWLHKADPNRDKYGIKFECLNTEFSGSFSVENTQSGVIFYDFPEYLEGEVCTVTVGAVYGDLFSRGKLAIVTFSADPTLYRGSVSGYITENNQACSNCDLYIGGFNIATDSQGQFFEVSTPRGLLNFVARGNQYEALITQEKIRNSNNKTGIRVFTQLKPDTEDPQISSVQVTDEVDKILNNGQEVEIEVIATDNLAIKEADFYYYDPVDDLWLYLGTQSANYNNVVFNWFIPSTLYGSNFKIKAISWDYQNNSSEPFEWGPFEIIDTTDYEAPTIQEFYVQEESDMIIENNKTINYVINGSDNEAVTSAKFSYYNPSTTEWILIKTENTNANNNIFNWEIPNNLSGIGFKLQAILSDASGNVSDPLEWGPFEIVDTRDFEAPVITDFRMLNNDNYVVKNQRDVLLGTVGTDNEEIATVEYHYYDPADTSWHYLGGADYWDGVFVWSVPASLEGTGYKIKSIITDTSGNVSEPVEWGPFEIIDGTMPTGTVEVVGIENNQWFLGETKIIQWEVESARPLASIPDITLYYGNSAKEISSSYDVTKNTVTYTVKLSSAYVTDTAYVSMEVCDDQYNCTDLTSSTFAIVDNTAPPQEPWGSGTDIFLANTNMIDRSLVDVFAVNENEYEIVYREWDNSDIDNQKIRLMYRKLINNVWQTPVVLIEYSDVDEIEDRIEIDEPQVMKSLDGSIHFTYIKSPNDNPDYNYKIDLDNREIIYGRINNNSLIIHQQITNAEFGSRSPGLTVSDTGTAHIIWRNGYGYVNDSGENTLRYKTGNGSGSWSSEEELTQTSTGNSNLTLYNSQLLANNRYCLKLNQRLNN